MIAWIICACLLIILIYFSIQLHRKIVIDKTETQKYQQEIQFLKVQKDNYQKDIQQQTQLIEGYQQKVLKLQQQYQQEVNRKTEDLDNYLNLQRQKRQEELNKNLQIQEENNKLKLQKLLQEIDDEVLKNKRQAAELIASYEQDKINLANEVALQQMRFEGLLAPIKQYEKEQQDRLFYTIQVPDEYKEDIDFLITTVAQKVQHPDIINRLVWAEYVKPYLDQTFKRIEIEDKPGIYKITNIDNNKSYIGKSTTVKKRISDHFKSSIGIKTIADQTVHHEIWKTGFWNWTIEIITYCEKEQLNELEKYYINFFQTNQYGFNKTNGGEG